MKFEIEWDPENAHHYRRKASTVHGWVTKLRGTLSGNEHVRSRGIREMREAADRRRRKNAERRPRKGFFALFCGGGGRKREGGQAVVLRRDTKRSTSSTIQRKTGRSSAKAPLHGRGHRTGAYAANRQNVVRATGNVSRQTTRGRQVSQQPRRSSTRHSRR